MDMDKQMEKKMYEALFDEVLAMQDAWGWTAEDAMGFIGENLDMYPELKTEYERFMEVMTEVYGSTEEPLTLH